MVRVSVGGSETSWMRLVTFDGEKLVDPPFPFSSLLVRKLTPTAELNLPALYSTIEECHRNTTETFPRVPAFHFTPNRQISSLQLEDGEQSYTKWDAALLSSANGATRADEQ